jgi:hypothetical protein
MRHTNCLGFRHFSVRTETFLIGPNSCMSQNVPISVEIYSGWIEKNNNKIYYKEIQHSSSYKVTECVEQKFKLPTSLQLMVRLFPEPVFWFHSLKTTSRLSFYDVFDTFWKENQLPPLTLSRRWKNLPVFC